MSEQQRHIDPGTTGEVKPTHIGGQALIEGIMMRGKYNWAVAVRRQDGSIYTEQHELASGKAKNSWMNWPVVRGCVALFQSLMLSFKALEVATTHAFSNESQAEKVTEGEQLEALEEAVDLQMSPDPVTRDIGQAEEEVVLSKKEIAGALVGGIALAVVLFMFLPAFLTNLIVGGFGKSSLVWNLVDGVIRVIAFIAYIFIISRMEDVRRMFSYHGAEHKTIHTHEHGQDLTLDNARQYSTLHVRCGTAFMLMAMIVAILVFTVVPIRAIVDSFGVSNAILEFVLVMVIRLALVPVIAGLTYELTVKWAGSHSDNAFVKIILWPGLMLQKLTTNEPDDEMLEVAFAATQIVLAREAQEEGVQEAKEASAAGLSETADAAVLSGTSSGVHVPSATGFER